MLAHGYPLRRAFYRLGQEPTAEERLVALQEERARAEREHARQMRAIAWVGTLVGVAGLLVSIAALRRGG